MRISEASGPEATFHRRELSAAHRAALLFATCVPWLLVFAVIYAAASSANGLLDISPIAGVIMFALIIDVQAMLYVVYLSLLEHNSRISDSARTLWRTGFIFTGPIACALYWWMHVRRNAVEATRESLPPARLHGPLHTVR